MSPSPSRRLSELISRDESELLAEWLKLQEDGTGQRIDSQTQEQSRQFLSGMRQALETGSSTDIHTPNWAKVLDILTLLSRDRARQGRAPSQTATFVFSLKQPLFTRLRAEMGRDAEALANEIWTATELLDRLGLYTTEVHQKSREEVIQRQQRDMMELSTPVMRMWEGVLALPLIGTLDSERTQVVMQNLLEAIVAQSAEIAIIDITGVPTVDTLVAQHLLKTVAAARLMGADCIISGIRPQIAQTIIHLGVDLADVTTKATLADAFQLALRKNGMTLSQAKQRKGAERWNESQS